MNKMVRKQFKVMLAVLTALFLVVSGANAQDYAFRVLGSKGNNQVDNKPLRTGSKINKDQTVKISDGSYLGLAHSTGKTLEISKAGTYKVSDLEKEVSQGNTDLVGKYAAFIAEELTSDDSKNNRFNAKVRTGSVTRDITNAPIQVLLPKNAEVYDGNITVKWYLKDDAKAMTDNFTFTVKNIFGKVVYEENVKGLQHDLDLNQAVFKDQKQLLLVEVTADGNLASDQIGLKKVKDSDAISIAEELAQLPSENTALNNLIKARFFEEKGLYPNAINAYEASLSILDLDQYRKYYTELLDFMKHGSEEKQ